MRANLLAEIEEREESAGRPLTDAEVASVLEAHGMPVIVASRYLPQHSLIGPPLFPFYTYTLKKSFPLVLLAHIAVTTVQWVAEGRSFAAWQASFWRLPRVLLTFWAIVTLGFAAFEYAVLKLAVDLWKLLSGAQQKQPGCVTVL